MYRDYIEAFAMSEERVSHGSFTKLVKSLKSFDQKAMKVVDYASGILLYDNISLLRDISGKIGFNFPKLIFEVQIC
jgi:hypothetical protein